MRTADFFLDVPPGVAMSSDPWSEPFAVAPFDLETVESLRRGPLVGRTDLEVAIALTQLVHQELEGYGTNSAETLNDSEIGAAIVGLRAVLRRVAVPFDLPYRNFTTFRSHWVRNGASNSWQARRDMLDAVFEPLHLRLIRLDEQTIEALAIPISPHAQTGWPVVDEEIRELRRRFGTASTAQDYRAIGTNCVGVLEALGVTVYDAEKHLRDGETVPPRDKTNMRIGRFIEDALPGARNADLRGLANKVATLAHHVKHAPTPTRRDAGIASDAVIMLANMLRRLGEDQ